MVHLELLEYGLIALLIYILGIIAAFHALLTVRTVTGTVAWVISLLTIPFLTLLPYLFLGRGRFVRYVASRRFVMQRVRQRIQDPDFKEVREIAHELLVTPTRGCMLTLSRLVQMPCTSHNHVRLLINGEATFQAIFDAIAQARRCIIIQFYIVEDDEIGLALQKILLNRSAQGIRVYFLYDGIGSHKLPGHYVDTLRAGGVEIYAFTTSRGFTNPLQVNFRNHRKLVIIDGERAFIGGHNVSDEYLGKKPPLSPWRDTHIEISGPQASGLQLVFAEDWYAATEELPLMFPPKKAMSGNMMCQAVPSGPADTQETGSLMFIEMINSAQKRLWIATPYFVPDESIDAALRLAALRGVDVRILIPARADHRVVFKASSLYAYEAVSAGIKMYYYQPGFMHQKVVLVDEDMTLIGSANLDNRSFRLNFELMIATCDTGFAAEVEKMLLDDLKSATLIDAQAFSKIPGKQHLMMRLARLFSPLL